MVTSMLEKAIEIEGLLRIIRDGNPLPETYTLLNMKAAALAEQAESLEGKASGSAQGKVETEARHADFVMEQPLDEKQQSQESGPTEVVFTIRETMQQEGSIARTIESLTDLGEEDITMTPEDLAMIEEDDILLSFEDTSDFPLPSAEETAPAVAFNPGTEAVTAAVAPQAEKTDERESSAELEAETEKGAPEQAEENSASNGEPEPAGQPEEHPTGNLQMKASSEPSATPKQGTKLKASFSLNDRYLYSRELFNGNMKMFDSTLDFLEGIEDYSIIEDYFYSELEWDPDNTHVATFMDILRPHFKES